MDRTILVIEDNEQNMYLCNFILTSHGYTVLQARTGTEGIAAVLKHRPDLVILDIQLPEMDGYAVAHELKNNTETKNIPIIAVTSYAMAGDRERILEAGCAGYIEKPIDPETFIYEVEKHLVTE